MAENKLTDHYSMLQLARNTLQTHSSSFLTQRTYSHSNSISISLLVVKLKRPASCHVVEGYVARETVHVYFFKMRLYLLLCCRGKGVKEHCAYTKLLFSQNAVVFMDKIVIFDLL